MSSNVIRVPRWEEKAEPSEAVLFDFDGTLSPTIRTWVEVFEDTLAEFGIGMSRKEIVSRLFSRPYPVTAAMLGIDDQERFSYGIRSRIDERLKAAELEPYASNVLRFARTLGLKMGIVTSTHRTGIDNALRATGLEGFFDCVISGSDYKNFKPHAEPALCALAALGVKGERALMVGDTAGDVLCAHAAGVRAVLYLPREHEWYLDFATQRQSEPEYEVRDLREVESIFAGLAKWQGDRLANE